jgi:hypothetical protein
MGTFPGNAHVRIIILASDEVVGGVGACIARRRTMGNAMPRVTVTTLRGLGALLDKSKLRATPSHSIWIPGKL